MEGEPQRRSLAAGLVKTARLIARALRLRCPVCGQGRIFRGWFTMHDRCARCGRPFARGPGFFLGSIYFNYGTTALLVIALFAVFFVTEWLTSEQSLATLTIFALVFPLWFFRYARALWIAFDELWDPTTQPPSSKL